MKTLVIVRGLPGAGKSTIAAQFGVPVRETDKFPGLYSSGEDEELIFHGYDPQEDERPLIAHAHEWCQRKVREDLAGAEPVAVVANTFVQGWEFTPYLEIADNHVARIVVLDVHDGWLNDEELADRNTHNVPIEAIARMRENWEADWRNADPRPPWERPTGLRALWERITRWLRK